MHRTLSRRHGFDERDRRDFVLMRNVILPVYRLPVYRDCRSVLQCVAVCCNELQCSHVRFPVYTDSLPVRCSVVQCVAVWCSALQCGAVRSSVVQCDAVWCRALQYGVVRCSVVQCVQCVAQCGVLCWCCNVV